MAKNKRTVTHEITNGMHIVMTLEILPDGAEVCTCEMFPVKEKKKDANTKTDA